jgi:hypothetical protein
MKRWTMIAVLGLLAIGLAGTVWAEGVPWKKDDNAKADADEKDAAAGTASDLKSELPPALYTRAIKPIEEKVTAAEGAMKPYEKEMEKDEAKRNAKLLIACKDRAANMYLGAMLAAKKAEGMVKTDAQKAAIKQQYEEPNQQKAIEMFLELAADAQQHGDLRMAVAYYRKVLSLDKDNAQAKEALTKLAQEAKESQQNGKKSGSKGGSSNEKKSYEQNDYKNTGRNDGNWGNTGRSSW